MRLVWMSGRISLQRLWRVVRDIWGIEALRAKIKAGTDALERGDFTEVDDAVSKVTSNGDGAGPQQVR